MKRIEDIKEFEDIDTYYEISKIVEEVFQDRVEVYKHLVTANKEIIILNNRIKAIEKQLQQKENIIKEVREKLNTQLAFTSSYQLNYQSAMSIIEQAKQILDKEVN